MVSFHILHFICGLTVDSLLINEIIKEMNMLDSETSGQELVWQKPTISDFTSNEDRVHKDRDAHQTQGICQDGSGNQLLCETGVHANACTDGGDATG